MFQFILIIILNVNLFNLINGDTKYNVGVEGNIDCKTNNLELFSIKLVNNNVSKSVMQKDGIVYLPTEIAINRQNIKKKDVAQFKLSATLNDINNFEPELEFNYMCGSTRNLYYFYKLPKFTSNSIYHIPHTIILPNLNRIQKRYIETPKKRLGK